MGESDSPGGCRTDGGGREGRNKRWRLNPSSPGEAQPRLTSVWAVVFILFPLFLGRADPPALH